MLPASIPPEEPQNLMKVTFAVLRTAHYHAAELLGADLIILLKSNLESGL